MPVRNAEPFLHECIDSIISQTETNWELLAVDDNSTDSSSEILKEYSVNDGRIKPLKTNGSGIIDALRTAYSESCGELITRMDADDRMASTKLEILKRNLISSDKGHLATGQVKYFSQFQIGDGYQRYESWLNRLTETGSNFKDIYKECVIPSPCWMVHKDDFEKCNSFEHDTYPEDYDLCFRFYREKLNVIPCNETLHFWRDHPTRASRNDENYADNRFLELKINWFIALDHDQKKELVLWGAGTKGKRIAKLLLARHISFRWVCNNQKKVGKEIYNLFMESVDAVDRMKDPQLIIAVANQEEQGSIRKKVQEEAYWFC